jgi:hypothetical protein
MSFSTGTTVVRTKSLTTERIPSKSSLSTRSPLLFVRSAGSVRKVHLVAPATLDRPARVRPVPIAPPVTNALTGPNEDPVAPRTIAQPGYRIA